MILDKCFPLAGFLWVWVGGSHMKGLDPLCFFFLWRQWFGKFFWVWVWVEGSRMKCLALFCGWLVQVDFQITEGLFDFGNIPLVLGRWKPI